MSAQPGWHHSKLTKLYDFYLVQLKFSLIGSV